jgi:REP element-mobilizing transposase RayT
MKLEKTSSQNDFPEKCLECAKASKPFIHDGCGFCQDLSFEEEILCDLNRSAQHAASLECHAFQPMLKLVETPGREAPPEVKSHSAGITLEKILDSDKVKYQRALARQRLAHDPDAVMLEIKYHFAWNVIGRRPVFREPAPAFDFISNTVTRCGEAVGGFSILLWLARDHIHLYVVSDGSISPDTMAQELKRSSEVEILERFPDLVTSDEKNDGLWDEAYFVETIG